LAKPTLFISDLHLDRSEPATIEQFLGFLDSTARDAQALYVLGDFFEAWIGDDDPEPEKQRVVAALKRLTSSGVRCFVMHGNRDFLLGRRFCRESGAELLGDHVIVEVFGERALLLHGDTLCIDDHGYQRLRRIVRNPLLKFVLRRLPLDSRLRLAERMRAGSKAHLERIGAATPLIMDVNSAAVVAEFEKYHVRTMIHGHTHRPAIHRIQTRAGELTRIVLGDWYTQGSVLRWDDQGYELLALTRPAGRSETGTARPGS
jgi:UDP-2,3-diacylglucosamine hydrolase